MFSRLDATRASESASRPAKRQKSTHPTDGPTTRSKRARLMSEETVAAVPAPTTDTPEMPATQNHSKMEEHLEHMRGLLTCKICQHYLTEPYGLACGHTYCYICLDTWIISQKKRSCPECRAAITQHPNPSLLLREMANMFFTNIELQGNEENVEELRKYAQEAAEKVAKDKAASSDGNLFKGIFNHYHHDHAPIYDAEDGIHRCPYCSHEILEDECTHCGHRWTDDEDEDLDFDLDDMYDDEDGLAMDVMEHEHLHEYLSDREAHRRIMREMRRGMRHGGRERAGLPQVINLDSEDESDSDESEEDSELDSFIDDEDGIGHAEAESDDSDETSLSVQQQRLMANAGLRSARRHVISDSDEDSDSDSTSDSDSEESESSETTATPSTMRNTSTVQSSASLNSRRGRHARAVSQTETETTDSDEDSEDDESEVSDEEPVRSKRSRGNNTRTRARSTIVIDDEDEDETGVSVASEAANTDYDTADDMTQSSSSEAHAMLSHDGPANDIFPGEDDESTDADIDHDSDDTAH